MVYLLLRWLKKHSSSKCRVPSLCEIDGTMRRAVRASTKWKRSMPKWNEHQNSIKNLEKEVREKRSIANEKSEKEKDGATKKKREREKKITRQTSFVWLNADTSKSNSLTPKHLSPENSKNNAYNPAKKKRRENVEEARVWAKGKRRRAQEKKIPAISCWTITDSFLLFSFPRPTRCSLLRVSARLFVWLCVCDSHWKMWVKRGEN